MQTILLLLIPFFVFASDGQFTPSEHSSIDNANHRPMDFDIFLKTALIGNPCLKASKTNLERAELEGSIKQRYQNPTLELETSSFSPDAGANKNGYRASLTQPLRLWGVGDAKYEYANAITQAAEATHSLQRAEFIRNLSLLYVEYVRSNSYEDLAAEEIALAQKIHDISTARFTAGTIPRAKLLQSKIDYESAQNRYEQSKLQSYRNFIELLKMAGINEELELSTAYTFKLKSPALTLSPDALLWQKRGDKSLAMEKVNENTLEWIDLFAGFEKEPDQDIARIGVSIPLTLFNDKSQERQISKIQTDQAVLMKQSMLTQQDIEKKYFNKESQQLQRLYKSTQKVLTSELELLNMFEESYKIANINLLEVQDIKNRVITTKRELIDLFTRMQSNTINQNYLQGAYNE